MAVRQTEYSKVYQPWCQIYKPQILSQVKNVDQVGVRRSYEILPVAVDAVSRLERSVSRSLTNLLHAD
jgi:hypothetical protein